MMKFMHFVRCLILLLTFGVFSFTVRAQTTDCPGAPASRLVIGQKGRVVFGSTSKLFAQPDRTALVLGTIPPGGVFTALEGPVCADSYWWWRVEYQGNQGWTTEATSDAYYVDPLVPFSAHKNVYVEPFQRLGWGLFTTGAQWSSDGNFIVVGGTLGIWKFDAHNLNAPPRNIGVFQNGARDVAISSKNQIAAVGCLTDDPQNGCVGTAVVLYDSALHQQGAMRVYTTSDDLNKLTSNDIEFTPDGQQVAAIVGSYVVSWRTYSISSFDILWHGSTPVTRIAFSPDSKLMAVTDGSSVSIFSFLDRRNPVTLIDSKPDTVFTDLAFSPDGSLLAVGAGTQIQLWDVASRKLVAAQDNMGDLLNMTSHTNQGNTTRVEYNAQDNACPDPCLPTSTIHMIFSSDGKRLVSGNISGSLTIFSIGGTGKLINLQQTGMIDPGLYTAITGLSLSPDGSRVVLDVADLDLTFNATHTLYIWDVQSERSVAKLSQGYIRPVDAVTFSPDGETLASVGGAEGGSVRWWNPATGRQSAILNQASLNGATVVFSPDGKLFAALYRDSCCEASWWNLEIWDSQTHKSRVKLQGIFFNDTATSLVFSPDGKWLASDLQVTELYDPTISIWNVDDLLNALPSDNISPNIIVPTLGDITALAYSPDGRFLAAATADDADNGLITLLDAHSYNPVRTLKGHTNPVWDIAFSPDGKLLASASGKSGRGGVYPLDHDDNTARLWDIATGQQRLVLQHAASVNTVAFNRDGTLLVTGSADGKIQFWNTATGELVNTITSRYGGITSLAFSPDNLLLAAGTGTEIALYYVPVQDLRGEG